MKNIKIKRMHGMCIGLGIAFENNILSIVLPFTVIEVVFKKNTEL